MAIAGTVISTLWEGVFLAAVEVYVFPCTTAERLVLKCCGRVCSGCKRLVKCSSGKGGKRERGDQSVTDCEQSIEIPHYLRTSRRNLSTAVIFIPPLALQFLSYGHSRNGVPRFPLPRHSGLYSRQHGESHSCKDTPLGTGKILSFPLGDPAAFWERSMEIRSPAPAPSAASHRPSLGTAQLRRVSPGASYEMAFPPTSLYCVFWR